MAITSKARIFTPAVVRRIIGGAGRIENQTLAHMSGTVIDDRSFKFDNPGTGLKSTQQLNVDWSRFENHTFFNSAEAKVNVAFDSIINTYPFDGTKEELERFFDRLTGFERYIFDLFPKNVGSLNFFGAVAEGTYIAINDRAGAMFPSLTQKRGNVVLDPEDESISFETQIFIPIGTARDVFGDGTLDAPDTYNENQVVCQKLDVFGGTGFTLGLLDSRLKNREIQSTDTSGNLLWSIPLYHDGVTESEPGVLLVQSPTAWGFGSEDDIIADGGYTLDSYDQTSAAESGYTGFYDDSTGTCSDGVSMDEATCFAVPGATWTDPRPDCAANDPNAAQWGEQRWGEWRDYPAVLEEDPRGLEVCDMVFIASSGSNYLSASIEVPKGRWAHICATYDRTYGQNNLKMYLDGKLSSTSERSYNMATFATAIDEADVNPALEPHSFHVSPLVIGSGTTHFQGEWGMIDDTVWLPGSDYADAPDRYDVGTGEPGSTPAIAEDNRAIPQMRQCFIPTQTFSGSLDEFRIWHSIKTESILKDLTPKNVFSDTTGNLRLCFRFNEPWGDFDSNDLVLDASGSGLHARITNFQLECKDVNINKNPADGSAGDPDDTVANPMALEKVELNPVLFPSQEDVKTLNCSLLDDANWYDVNNPNMITKLIPQHYLMEAQAHEGLENIDGYLHDEYGYTEGRALPGMGQLGSPQIIASMLYTWARYFDEIKMFLDHFSNLMHVDYDSEDTIADAFLPFLANQYGFDLPRCFSDASLEQYKDGENLTPDQGLSDMGLQFVQNQIWRRVLVNVNEILHSKGTRHGIRALMLSMGISPDKLFRFREYGGSRTKTLNDVRRNRVEVSAMLDFSGTMAGVNDHRPAPGIGNPFYYVHEPTVNPWDADYVAHDLGATATDYLKAPFISPFTMSPFLSGSRVEVGPCEPDTDIPIATSTISLDYSLPGNATLGDPPPELELGNIIYRESSDFLADASSLDRKVIKLKDIDETITYFQFITSDESSIDVESYVEINIIGILDRLDIAQEITEVISDNTEFRAYNVSEDNDGIVRLYQPRGGRSGNYPVELLQYDGDDLVPWNGLMQAVDELGAKLWKRPDNEDGSRAQLTNIDDQELYTADLGASFNTAAGDIVYQSQLAELGYSSNPQMMIWNSAGTSEIGVWKHLTTGVYITYEDHPSYGVPGGVFGDSDMGAPYEPVTVDQTEDDYANEHGYVPVYYAKPYFEAPDFSGGELGVINKDHPDLTAEEALFIKENGSYHGFDYTPNDGLFTSGSFTVEAIYKFDKPTLTFYPVTQSLMRIQSTATSDEDHVLLTNLVVMREPEWDQETGEEIIVDDGVVKLFIRPELENYWEHNTIGTIGTAEEMGYTGFYLILDNTNADPVVADPDGDGIPAAGYGAWDQETWAADVAAGHWVPTRTRAPLVLEVDGVNIFNGQQWNIAYGRERADQIESEVSSSYFLRVSRNFRGEVREYHESKRYYQESERDDPTTFWSNLGTDKNQNGAFITIGSQSLPDHDAVLGLGLNTDNETAEVMTTHFSGEVAQLRFWSKALTTAESKEHIRNPFSVGVEDPSKNFNFATVPSGSWERLRMDVSFDQQVTASIEDEAADAAYCEAGMTALGWLEMFDFSQASVSGSRGALWRPAATEDKMNFHMMSYGFEAEISNIKPERFDYGTIDAKFDEQAIDNKIRVRGFEYTHNIEEFQTNVAPVHSIQPSETPSDDTRFSIDISSYQALNDDIIKIFATLDSLDNVLGAPENLFTQSYPDLEYLREVYFNRLTGNVNIRSFFEFFKWFDNAIGLLLKKLVPRKTHFMGVNFVIESHMLERAKMTYNYSDVYLGDKNRHGLKGTMTLQQFVGQVKRF